MFQKLFQNKTGQAQNHQGEASAPKNKRKKRAKRQNRKPSDGGSNIGNVNVNTDSEGAPIKDNEVVDSFGTQVTRDRPNHSSLKRKRPVKRPRKSAPSEAAMDLSRRLKQLSQQKKLDQAINLFQQSKSIIDEHHLCILVDCCSRCGDILQAESLLEKARNDNPNLDINIETSTALLKGYCHSGMMVKAMHLFETMCENEVARYHPNLRTLNTFLRGCLWSATSVETDARSGSSSLDGGIHASEVAWDLYRSCDCQPPFDSSSYEYSTSLLCQALHVDRAQERINELSKLQPHSTHEASNDHDSEKVHEQSKSEALALCYLNLANAYALLQQVDNCVHAVQKAVDFSQKSKKLLSSLARTSSNKTRFTPSGQQQRSDGRRTESNEIFRTHRLSSVENDAKALKQCVQGGGITAEFTPRCLSRMLLTRVLFLTGGGTTDVSSTKDVSNQHADLQRQLVNSAFFSFGLSRAVSTMIKGIDSSRLTPLKKKECNRILGTAGLQGGFITNDGYIDFAKIFSKGLRDNKKESTPGQAKPSKASQKRPLDIELGAGFGEWIVHRAKLNPTRNHVAVELRADRVGKILHRAFLTSADVGGDDQKAMSENICVVGAESGSFLRNRVKNGTISTVFINHPEPPTQTYGTDSAVLAEIMAGGPEPAHMLNCEMIKAAGECLQKLPESKLVIVTDNKWYGRLICATIVKIKRGNSSSRLLANVNLSMSSNPHLRVTERFGTDGGHDDDAVILYESECGISFGQSPAEEVAKTVNSNSQNNDDGTSYFDRLWQAGGGAHAQKTTRFFIVMGRMNVLYN